MKTVKERLFTVICALCVMLMFTVALIACGGNNGNHDVTSGESVTEHQWKAGIEKLIAANNFTYKMDGVRESEIEIYKGSIHNLYRFDIKNGRIKCEIFYYSEAEQRTLQFESYFIRDDENSELWWRVDNGKFETADELTCRYFYMSEGETIMDAMGDDYDVVRDFHSFRHYKYWNWIDDGLQDSPYYDYANFEFDTTDGGYLKEIKEVYDGNYVDTYSLKLYFNGGYCNGMKYTCIEDEYSALGQHSYYDIGSTVVTVPNEIIDAIANYKVANDDWIEDLRH